MKILNGLSVRVGATLLVFGAATGVVGAILLLQVLDASDSGGASGFPMSLVAWAAIAVGLVAGLLGFVVVARWFAERKD